MTQQIKLTERERQVLEYTAMGYRSQDIAEILDIAIQSVKWHKSKLFNKLKVKNAAHAVSVAYREGLLVAPYRQPQVYIDGKLYVNMADVYISLSTKKNTTSVSSASFPSSANSPSVISV